MSGKGGGLIAVTGATGGIGGRVARRLAARGVAQRLVVRDPSRAPGLPGAHVAQASYGDGPAMRDALRGVTSLLLVSAAEAVERVAWHVSAIDAARAAGVARIVYVSFLGAAPDATFTLARQHWQTEQHIRSTGAAFTFLRDSLYLDVFPYFVGADGAIRGPAGDGRVGAVARDDIADAAVAVLCGPAAEDSPLAASKPATGAPSTRTPHARQHDGQTYDLTGPGAVSLSEIAAELSAASGREIRYEPETIAEAYASRAHYGAPHWEVRGWVSSYAAIATGELALVTDDVATLTGRAPTSLAQFVAAHPGEIDRMVARLG